MVVPFPAGGITDAVARAIGISPKNFAFAGTLLSGVLRFLIVAAARGGTAADVVGASIFVATIAVLYLASTLYHALPRPRVKRVFRVLDHGAYVMGPEVRQFEAELAAFGQAPLALSCANGTDAIAPQYHDAWSNPNNTFRAVVATRMHAAILAMLGGTPALAIGYAGKAAAVGSDRALAKGLVENIGGTAILRYEAEGRSPVKETAEILEHKIAVERVLALLTRAETGVIGDRAEIEAVGHRVVHGAGQAHAGDEPDGDVREPRGIGGKHPGIHQPSMLDSDEC